MILIIDMNWKKDSLAFHEFVSPIVSAVAPIEECKVKHFLDIDPSRLGDYDKIVLSGTTLKDHATLTQLAKFSWIKTCNKPILGICAGIQTISLLFGEPLKNCLQIGIADIKTLTATPLFEGNFKAYTLHNFSVEPSPTFTALAESTRCTQAVKHIHKEIYGVLFHPEVRNLDILQRFVKLKH
jgi:GMP synthase-like glutamine amidotransferase